jgi:hypothetical protein
VSAWSSITTARPALGFGPQTDTRVIRHGADLPGTGQALNGQAVANYIAKCATKTISAHGLPSLRIRCETDIDQLRAVPAWPIPCTDRDALREFVGRREGGCLEPPVNGGSAGDSGPAAPPPVTSPATGGSTCRNQPAAPRAHGKPSRPPVVGQSPGKTSAPIRRTGDLRSD